MVMATQEQNGEEGGTAVAAECPLLNLPTGHKTLGVWSQRAYY